MRSLCLLFVFSFLLSLSFSTSLGRDGVEKSSNSSDLLSPPTSASGNDVHKALQRRWTRSSKPLFPIPYNTRIKYLPINAPDMSAHDLLDLQKWKTRNQDHRNPKTNEFQVKDELGQGGQGVVWRILWNDRNIYALKASSEISEEIAIMEYIEQKLARSPAAHRNIIQLKYAIYIKDRRRGFLSEFLVMEYCNRGTAKDLVERRYYPQPKTTESMLRDVLVQTTRGLKVLHDIRVFHLDVKPSNLLLVREEETRKMVVKIADFGLASTEMWLDVEGGTRKYAAPGEWISFFEYCSGLGVGFAILHFHDLSLFVVSSCHFLAAFVS